MHFIASPPPSIFNFWSKMMRFVLKGASSVMFWFHPLVKSENRLGSGMIMFDGFFKVEKICEWFTDILNGIFWDAGEL